MATQGDGVKEEKKKGKKIKRSASQVYKSRGMEKKIFYIGKEFLGCATEEREKNLRERHHNARKGRRSAHKVTEVSKRRNSISIYWYIYL